MRPNRLTPIIAGALIAAMLSLSAGAATKQWSGMAGGCWVRLYTDGQKATGAVRATIPDGMAELELSGAGAGVNYSGALTGIGRRNGVALSLQGTWSANLTERGARFEFRLASSAGKAGVTRTVPLDPGASFNALVCSWVRGTATRQGKSGPAVALRSGDRLQLGDTIRTGASSAAIVVLGDRSVVMMQDATQLVIPEVEDNRNGVQSTRLNSGKVWFAVRKVQDRGRFEVETDEAVAAVRGTEFSVEITADGDTEIVTAEGQVDCADAARRVAFTPVAAGQRWLRPRGGFPKPGPPRPLPMASGKFDLAAHHRKWSGLLRQCDGVWPFRREGKAAFWEDRLGPGRDARPAPGAPLRPGPRRPRR